MKTLKLLVATSLLTCACGGAQRPGGDAPPAPPEAAAGAGEDKTNALYAAKLEPHFTEGNGQVVEVPVPGSVVAIRLMFYTGSIDDPPTKEGLTALTTRLMVEGGTKRQTYPEILRALYPLATEIDAAVEKEQTTFHAKVHVDHVARFVPILADVIREPRLPEADFERLRQDMINDLEKRLRATDDENLGKELLELMLYAPEHPYGHYDGGSVESLRSITLDDVRAHAARVFGRRRLVIGIGGAVSPEIRQTITGAFAGLGEGAARVAEIPRVGKPARPEVVIAEKPAKAVAISIGFPHDVFRGHPDWPALGLVQSYFGEHRQFHGVLMSELREKRGLNYGDYAYVEEFAQEGWSRNVRTNLARRRQHFEIWIRPVDPKDAVFSIRLALFLLDRMVKQGVPAEGVDDARRFLAGYTRLWELTPMRKLGYALDDHFYGISGHLDVFRGALERLTAPEVDAAVRRHLVSWPVKIAIVAPDAAALKAQLLSGERSEKRYDAAPDPSVLELDKAAGVHPLPFTEADIRTVPVDALFAR